MYINKNTVYLIILLALGLGLRIAVTPYYTHESDMGLWFFWARAINEKGMQDFFNKGIWTDYLPLYFYFLLALEKIRLYFQLDGHTLFKMPAILADLGATILIYKIAQKISVKNALFVSSLYLFNPAVFANSAMWGQVDGLGGFLVILCVYLFVEKRFILLGIAMAMAILFKPLYLIILPILFLAQYRKDAHTFFNLHWKSIRNSVVMGVSLLIATYLLVLPFTSNPLNVPSIIVERYETSLGQYHYASVNAFNFWGYLGMNFKSDDTVLFNLTYNQWGLVLFILIYASSCSVLISKMKEDSLDRLMIYCMMLAFLSIFTFSTRVHERHLFTAFPLLVLLVPFSLTFFYSYIILSFVYLANLYYGIEYLYGITAFDSLTFQFFSAIIVIVNIALFIDLTYKYMVNHQKFFPFKI